MSEIKVTLSDWLFKMVEGRSVLTLHRDYFRLRKPLDRRIYELARKHCGAQAHWSISVETLQNKTGASTHLRVFRQTLLYLVAHRQPLDLAVEITGDTIPFHQPETPARPEERRE